MTMVSDLITNALTEIGVLAAGEVPTAQDLAFCFSKLNRLLDRWNSRKIYAYYVESLTFPFGESKEKYTIGPGEAADFAAARPVRLMDICNLVSGGFRTPIPLITVPNYSAIPNPGMKSDIPTRIYYQPTFPDGTLFPWPQPANAAMILELFAAYQLARFEDEEDDISFPPGYEEAITMSLAEVLCPAFGRPLPAEITEQARRARADIQAANIQPAVLVTDYPVSAGGGMQWDPQIRGWR